MAAWPGRMMCLRDAASQASRFASVTASMPSGPSHAIAVVKGFPPRAAPPKWRQSPRPTRRWRGAEEAVQLVWPHELGGIQRDSDTAMEGQDDTGLCRLRELA